MRIARTAVNRICTEKETMRRLNLALLLVASIVLFLTLRQSDWTALGGSLLQGGRYLPLLLLPYALTSYLWTLSWRLLLVSGDGRPSVQRLFFVRLAGESLNQLTPTASFGGEPFKAYHLHAAGVGWSEAAASLAIHKALMVLSLVLYIAACLAVLPVALPGFPHGIAASSWAGMLLLAGGGGLFMTLQRRNPCTSLTRTLQKFGACPAQLLNQQERLADLDASLSAFYRDHARAGWMALWLFFLGWVMHAVEVYLIFRMLGHPISFRLAFCLDGLSQLAAGLGFMIPASLGVQDGGNILLSLGFNLGATLGAGFSILRRFREACWLLLGLLVVAVQGKGDTTV